jgi:hypothetical protein
LQLRRRICYDWRLARFGANPFNWSNLSGNRMRLYQRRFAIDCDFRRWRPCSNRALRRLVVKPPSASVFCRAIGAIGKLVERAKLLLFLRESLFYQFRLNLCALRGRGKLSGHWLEFVWQILSKYLRAPGYFVLRLLGLLLLRLDPSRVLIFTH